MPAAKKKAEPPRNLTPGLCEKLRNEMLAACQKVADSYGLSVLDGGVQDVDLRHSFQFAVKVGTPLPDGSVYDPDQALFEAIAEGYGLVPADFGREFGDGFERFRVTGIDPRRPKYPINAERMSDGRKFKFTADMVNLEFKARPDGR